MRGRRGCKLLQALYEFACFGDTDELASRCSHALLILLRHRQISYEQCLIARDNRVVQVEGYESASSSRSGDGRAAATLQEADGPSAALDLATCAGAAEAALDGDEALGLDYKEAGA
jgi:hypothetical protein